MTMPASRGLNIAGTNRLRFPEMRRRWRAARSVMRGHGVIFNVTVSGHGMSLEQRTTPFNVHLGPGGTIRFDQWGVINGPTAAIEIPNLAPAGRIEFE